MTATNMTVIVVAVIILSSFKLKSFIKPIYMLWLVLSITLVPIVAYRILLCYPYRGQVVTATINVVLFGFIAIKILEDLIVTKKMCAVRLPLYVGWIIMLTLMFLSVNENIWPIWFAIIFGLFYLTEFHRETERIIYVSLSDGIILGFFVIQGLALLFRPYDVVRYLGLYINPNFNALFYLMSYSAFLCKWFFLKKEGKSPVFRAIIGALAASMYGFCIFTGSKSAVLAMLILTVPFTLLMLKYCESKAISFIRCWMILGIVGLVSIPIVYGAIRYMPTIHLHPLYFEGEYSTARVQPGESRDSEKYISFEYAMESNMGRYLYLLPNIKEYIDSYITLKVHAAEPSEYQTMEAIFSEEEVAAGIDPIKLRQEIRLYFLKRLNMLGHTNDYEGAPTYPGHVEPHAHNVFIQMAFLYGIPAGIMFIAMILAFVPGCTSLMKVGEDYKVCLISCFVLAFVVFGFFEIDWMCGQLPFAMVFLLFRDVVRKTGDHEDVIKV